MAKSKVSAVAEEMDNFIEVYITGSTIKTIKYSELSGKWTLDFKDKTFLDFNTFEEMREWLHLDQFGE